MRTMSNFVWPTILSATVITGVLAIPTATAQPLTNPAVSVSKVGPEGPHLYAKSRQGRLRCYQVEWMYRIGNSSAIQVFERYRRSATAPLREGEYYGWAPRRNDAISQRWTGTYSWNEYTFIFRQNRLTIGVDRPPGRRFPVVSTTKWRSLGCGSYR